MSDEPLICLKCQKRITGEVVWLAEDYRNDGGEIDGPYSLHPACAEGPWPLYEVSASEAAHLAILKDSLAKKPE